MKELEKHLKDAEKHIALKLKHDSLLKNLDSIMENRMVIIGEKLKDKQKFLDEDMEVMLRHIDSLVIHDIPEISEEQLGSKQVIKIKRKKGKNDTEIIVLDRNDMDDKKFGHQSLSITITRPEGDDMEMLRDFIKHPANEPDLSGMMILPGVEEGKTRLQFTLAKSKKVEVYILDVNGEELYSDKQRRFEGTYDKTIGLEMDKGTYYLLINGENSSMASKIEINENDVHYEFDLD
ncbi:MAG: hypothetical protein K9I94_14615 [Bacteroidales bacterium]|nr:hypothetical protein [Bacteroidales bacterium]